MDTSAEYVKMCDCPEIQGQRGLHGDRWNVLAWHEPNLEAHGISDHPPLAVTGHEVWLPRQDQLQEMLGALCGTWEALLVELSSWHSPWGALHNEYASSFKSFEQAWLAFVMHEKHNKHWNGEEWV